MKIFNRLFLIVLLSSYSIILAQLPSQPTPPGGGTGTTGTGAPASSIDMYVLGLGIVAIMMILFYTFRKQKLQKI